MLRSRRLSRDQQLQKASDNNPTLRNGSTGDGDADIRSETAPDGEPENDIRRAIMIKPDLVRVVNIEFNKAIVSYRSHTDIFFFERYNYDPAETRPSDFWT